MAAEDPGCAQIAVVVGGRSPVPGLAAALCLDGRVWLVFAAGAEINGCRMPNSSGNLAAGGVSEPDRKKIFY
jgi:hypothetical protein